MRYISVTPEEKRLMLQATGASTIEELFASIPAELRMKTPLDIPPPVSETGLIEYFESLARRNANTQEFDYFLGAGAYHHFIPTVIDSIISRAEFYTCYTPYQPEVSQGTLQAMFEFQTLICQLTGMEVANASLYDGSSALAEAALMAVRTTRRSKLIMARTVHPAYRRVVETYAANLEIEIEDLPFTDEGSVDLAHLEGLVGDQHAAVVVQSPNFFGVIEQIQQVSDLCSSSGALSVVVVTEALSLGILKPPGEMGADIVVAEGQSLGLPMGFGGPYVGLFATRDRYKRQMPGRLVGQTVDGQGKRGFVLTLATREQFIRREKATSNICTNQGLCALMVTIFLCTLGKQGLRELAEQNLRKSHHLRSQLGRAVHFSGPTFNEMVVDCNEDPVSINRRLIPEGIIGGLPLGEFFPELSEHMLVCVTEANRSERIRALGEALIGERVTT